MIREWDKDNLKIVMQGAQVKGICWFAFGTDEAGLASLDNCTHVVSLNSAYWPFEIVAEIGVTPTVWNALAPAPTTATLVAVDGIKAVWVGVETNTEARSGTGRSIRGG